ncbi:MAG: beta family protein [Sulfuricella sp.]|nr:beta family protein [Sulfuricella sp.]
MLIAKSQYVPILKWRQGEYQALSRLDDQDKNAIVPLLVIPPIEYDFEEKRLKKTVHEHIEPFPKRFCKKWGQEKALIDFHNSLENAVMDSGAKIIHFIFDELRKASCTAIPVVNLSRTEEFIKDIKQVVIKDKRGVCTRIKLSELMGIDLSSRLQALIQYLDLDYSQVDLVIDLGKPDTFEPYPAFSKALVNAIKKIASIEQYRSLTIVATSLQLATIRRPGGEVIRHEWQLYKQLVTDLEKIRIPSFGDYTIETPEFSNQDMRLMKPSGKIVYTGNDVWLVSKGPVFRGNESQMNDHCKSIAGSVHWCKSDYSYGDKIISDTSLGIIKASGSLSTWKQVGVSHHLVKVAEQLSMFHAS